MQIVKYAFQQHGDDRGMLVALDVYKRQALDDAQIIMENAFRVNGRADYIPNIKKLL